MRTGASWADLSAVASAEAEVVVIPASETGKINAVTMDIVEDFIW
jgi:hypothetical protein